MKFEVDSENPEGALIYETVLGHSPEFTWPEFHVYRWTDEGVGKMILPAIGGWKMEKLI